MMTVRTALLCAAFTIAGSGLTSSAVFADTWGCSYDKCLAVCYKVGGKYCPKYCEDRLADKRRTNVCK